MKNIELVIKIPHQMYQKIKETNMFISGRSSGKRFDYILFNAVNTGTPLNEIRAKIAAKIGGNGSENDGLDKALAIIDEYIREGKAKLIE